MNHHQRYIEELLLPEIASGNENAFRQLVLQYHARLNSYVLHFTRSRQQTEEIVQDVFMQLWLNRATLGEIRCIKNYLFVISRNRVFNALRDELRQRKRRLKWEYQQSVQLVFPEEKNNFSIDDMLDQAIMQLPPQQQTAWVMSRRKGKKYADIAREMQLSRETVKKHIRLANDSISRFMGARIDLVTIVVAFLLASK